MSNFDNDEILLPVTLSVFIFVVLVMIMLNACTTTYNHDDFIKATATPRHIVRGTL